MASAVLHVSTALLVLLLGAVSCGQAFVVVEGGNMLSRGGRGVLLLREAQRSLLGEL